jgi:small-conductance mechanosensitive channel
MDINNAYGLISEKLITWLHELIKLLPNIILAAVVLVLGMFVSRWVKKITERLIGKVSQNDTLNSLFASIIYFTFIGITLFTVLGILHLDKAVTSLLAGAGILGLALAFAFQDIAANFISGIFISFRRPIHHGDIVKIKDYMGKVEGINLRDTVIRTFQGQMVIIPNKDVFQSPIENYSLLGKRRLDLTIGVSYGDDLEKVKEITLNTVKQIKELSDDEETTLFFQEFGGSSINFLLRLWINTPEQPVYLSVGSQVIMLLKKAYDENNIMLPFNTTTLDFGGKGGVKLDEIPIRVVTESKAL